MVGCGAMSAEWLRGAKELGVEIAALVDLNIEAARLRAAEFQLEAPLFDNVDAAIRASRAQMLFDCTIPAAHVAVDEKALMNGMHVLVEKPLATTLEDAARVVELAPPDPVRAALVGEILSTDRVHGNQDSFDIASRALIAAGVLAATATASNCYSVEVQATPTASSVTGPPPSPLLAPGQQVLVCKNQGS